MHGDGFQDIDGANTRTTVSGAGGVMKNGWTERIKELEAENKRLRELVDGATEVVEISNFTFPAQREWKAAWLKKAAKAMKEASHE